MKALMNFVKNMFHYNPYNEKETLSILELLNLNSTNQGDWIVVLGESTGFSFRCALRDLITNNSVIRQIKEKDLNILCSLI